MKKLLFTLIIIFCFCIIPKAQALTSITFYDASYRKLYTSFDMYEKFVDVKGVRRVRINWSDCNIIESGKYQSYLDFGLSALYGYPHWTGQGFYAGGTYQNNSSNIQTVEQIQNGSNEYFIRNHVTMNFTANKNTNTCFTEFDFGNYNKDITFYSLYNQSMQMTGNGTSDAIFNSAYNIMQNDNWNTSQIMANNNSNTNKLIEKQKENIEAIKNLDKTQQETNQNINNQTETIKDNNIDDASNSANSFFNDFSSDDYGLSDIVTLPLKTIKTVTSSNCSSLKVPLPYVKKNLTLPCIRSVFEQHFNPILLIYQTITFGFISYYVIVRIFNLVKDFKNPEHDEIEVLDL